METFSMKYINWASSCYSFLAACLGVGRHDIGRLNALDGRTTAMGTTAMKTKCSVFKLPKDESD